jgi:predicted  nucleic acid-binding Zn-ribbon protein
MKSISTRVEDETADELEGLADERGSSVSQVTRDLIRKGLEYDDLKSERDRLERQLVATNSRIDDVTELVAYVDAQRELERYRERRERKLDQAGVLTRAKWWITGIPVDDVDEIGDESESV